MTLQELYAKIGGDYEKALTVLRIEKLMDKHIRKFGESDVVDRLIAAGKTMDATELFESAHAVKGVCANLGLMGLCNAASGITEEFRPGNERKMSDEEVKEKIDQIEALYKHTVDGIKEYSEG